MDKTTVLTRKSGIMTADMNGAAVMLDIESGKYYNLGDVGGRIWELLEAPTSVCDIIDQLTKEYDITKEKCEEDTLYFLCQLEKCGLVIEK